MEAGLAVVVQSSKTSGTPRGAVSNAVSLFSPVQVLHSGELTLLSPVPHGITPQPSCRAGNRLSSAFHPACSAVPRNADSGDVLVLVDSEDDEEGKGSEEALSSCTEHEAMALVRGSRAQAAHLNHLMEGEQPPAPAELWAFPEQLPGREEFVMAVVAEMLLLCALCR